MKNRRDYLNYLSLGSAFLVLPILLSGRKLPEGKKNALKFGLCGDVHKDIMHDANVNMDIYGYPIMPSISDKSIAL